MPGSSASWRGRFDGPPGADDELAMIHIANALQTTVDAPLPRLSGR